MFFKLHNYMLQIVKTLGSSIDALVFCSKHGTTVRLTQKVSFSIDLDCILPKLRDSCSMLQNFKKCNNNSRDKSLLPTSRD